MVAAGNRLDTIAQQKDMVQFLYPKLHESFVKFLNEITPKDSTIKLFKEIIKRTASRKLADTNKNLAKCRKRNIGNRFKVK